MRFKTLSIRIRGHKTLNMWSISDFDTEKFISEIQNRPCIWNSKHPEYVDRELKIQAWNELVDEYGGEGLSRDERKKLCQHLQKKWRNIRDCFVKTYKSKLKYGDTKKVTYSFFDNLLFLTETFSGNNGITITNVKSEPVHTHCIELDPLSVVSTVSSGRNTNDLLPRKKKRVDDSSESGDSGVSHKKEKKDKERDTEVEEDEDRLFFLSLVKEFTRIPEHQRIQAKIDLLKVIKDAQFPNWSGHAMPEEPRYRY